MARQTLLCIVGKTGAGKDTIAKYIEDMWGIKAVCSYTTRPMRPSEKNGVQHRFISKEMMEKIRGGNAVVAYTKNEKTGVEYCAARSCLTDSLMVYIINPAGIAYLKEHRPDIDLIQVYVKSDNDCSLERALNRGDELETVIERLGSEAEFDDYYRNCEFDVCIDNTGDFSHTKAQISTMMANYGIQSMK